MSDLADAPRRAPQPDTASRSTTGSAASRSARRASSSPPPRRTAPRRWPRARRRSTTLKTAVPLWKKEVYEGRRGVDRPGVVEPERDPRLAPRDAPDAPTFPNPEPTQHGERGYEPLQPRSGVGELARKLFAPVLALGFLVIKFGGFLLKFKVVTTGASMLVSIAAYAWLWGWPFAVGFVLLILVHELGHVIELRRQGVHASAPLFIPFLGAVDRDEAASRRRVEGGARGARRADPRLARRGSCAGGSARRSTRTSWSALAFVGFFLNLFNLIPIAPLDGGRAVAALHPAIWLARARRPGRCSSIVDAEPAPGDHRRPRRPRPWQRWRRAGRTPSARRTPDVAQRASGRRRLPRARRRCSSLRDGRDARRAGLLVRGDRTANPRRVLERRTRRSHATSRSIARSSARGFEAVQRIDRPAVSLFGSARVGEEHPDLRAARGPAAASPRRALRSSPAAGRA